MYQTFNDVSEIAGKSLKKPKRRELLLAKAELLPLFDGLDPLVYHDQQELAQVTHPLLGKVLLIAQKPRRLGVCLKCMFEAFILPLILLGCTAY